MTQIRNYWLDRIKVKDELEAEQSRIAGLLKGTTNITIFPKKSVTFVPPIYKTLPKKKP